VGHHPCRLQACLRGGFDSVVYLHSLSALFLHPQGIIQIKQWHKLELVKICPGQFFSWQASFECHRGLWMMQQISAGQ